MSAINAPREPSEYHPTIHFGDMVRERRIPGPAIAACIKEGDIEPGDEPGTVKYIGQFRGCYYTVVADPESREAITVYTNGY